MPADHYYNSVYRPFSILPFKLSHYQMIENERRLNGLKPQTVVKVRLQKQQLLQLKSILQQKMKSASPRLWKQIGSLSLKKPHLAHPIEDGAKIVENSNVCPNQQIMVTFNESIIQERNDSPDHKEVEKDSIQQLVLFDRERKQSVSSDILLTNFLRDLPEQRLPPTKNRKEIKIQKKDLATMTKLENRRVYQILKGEVDQIRRQVERIKIQIKKEVIEVQKFITALWTGIQKITSERIEISTKQCIIASQELEKLKLKLQEKTEKEKGQEQEIRKKDIEIISQRIQVEKLRRQIQILNADGHRQLKQNTALSQKVFDLEQKLLGFDLRVQEQVQSILASLCSKSDQDRQLQINKQQIENEEAIADHAQYFRKQSSKANITSSQNISLPYKFCQSNFNSPKRRESNGPKRTQEEPKRSLREPGPSTMERQGTAKKRLESLLSRGMYESQPMGGAKGPVRMASNSDFHKHWNNTERVRTVQSKELTTQNSLVECRRWQGDSRSNNMSSISEKLNRIRVEIEQEIKNAGVHY